MMTYIKLTPYLNQTYNFIISRYDDHMDYQKQLCIDKKIFDIYITKNIFHDNFRMNLNKQSMNFLTYILVQTNILLANTAKQLAIFGNKKSISDSAVIHSLHIHFSGKLLDDILKKYDSVSTLLKNKEKDDSEKGEKDTLENNQEDNQEDNQKDNQKEKDDNASDKDESDKDESEKESDDDANNSEEDNNSESESESEVEENPTPTPTPKPVAKSNTKAKDIKTDVKPNEKPNEKPDEKPDEKPKKVIKKK